jgi:endo-1,3-1,4-beta-glycanase ExoK
MNSRFKYPAIVLTIIIMIGALCYSIIMPKKFEDHFNNLDAMFWSINQFTFPESGSAMTTQAISTANSILSITLEKKCSPVQGRGYAGGEVASQKYFGYGDFTVRLKNSLCEGTVSSFFLMNKWKAKDWVHKEIDIEFLGKNPNQVQFTVHLYPNKGTEHVFFQHTHNLGFDSSKDFHDYTIQWRKDSISWLVDGRLAHTENRITPDSVMQIRMNHWAANENNIGMVQWLGHIDENALPSIVSYDWVKYKGVNE